jgi:hypothetical protein
MFHFSLLEPVENEQQPSSANSPLLEPARFSPSLLQHVISVKDTRQDYVSDVRWPIRKLHSLKLAKKGNI